MSEIAKHWIAANSESLESSSAWYSDPMTEGARHGGEEPPLNWLTAAEVNSWLSVHRVLNFEVQ